MPWPVHPTGFFGARGDNDTYRIERSLRFNSADSAYLNRTPASAGNRKTWTFSAWIKLGNTNPTIATPLGTILSGSNGGPSLINSSGLRFCHANDPVGTDNVRMTSAIVRDPSAWYHVVWWCDTTQAGTRWKIYINGVEQTLETPAGYNGEPAQNTDLSINAASQHLIGQYAGSYFDGYMTEIYLIDGQAMTPSSFGETDPITGRWKAKAYSGTYGTNGFYLKFADNSGTTSTTLGKDSSGNGNNWTPNNFSVTAGAGNDSLVDSPTNYGTDSGVGGEVRGNYCTINPLDIYAMTLSNGNLETSLASNIWTNARATMGVSSGKWYWEVRMDSGSTVMVGISNPSASLTTYSGGDSNGRGYYNLDGTKYKNGSPVSYGSSYTSGDIIGVALDMDSNKITFYKNNVSQGEAFNDLSGSTWFPSFSIYGTARLIANFGQRPFAHTAPAGFRSLCTTNLPTPTIRKPSSAMDVVTYTGNGSARSITGLGFSPDLVWIKGRSGATDHAIYDSVRGVQLDLASNLTSAETTQSQGLTAFNSDGFSIGTLAKLNTNSATYVAWAWDEAPIAGMDIVSFTGNGGSQTISHNLGVAPKMIICKARGNTQDWYVYHSSIGNTGALLLNSTAATQTSINYWANVSPTSFGFAVGPNFTNLYNYIAYLFAEVEGFSKFGSYTGNGSADGPFVWCGFRPKFVIIKEVATAGAFSWSLWDSSRGTANVISAPLYANSAAAETTSAIDVLDFLSNGIKIRGTNSGTINYSTGNYIFAAFAESPFKYARAR